MQKRTSARSSTVVHRACASTLQVSFRRERMTGRNAIENVRAQMNVDHPLDRRGSIEGSPRCIGSHIPYIALRHNHSIGPKR